MKKLIFLFCITFGLAQNNGIRSLNGSLNNSQRLNVDTTSSATFRWATSNGVHTLYLPYRIVNPSSGSFKWNVSGQTAKYDSLRLIAGSNVSLTQSGNTVTIATSGGGSVGNADSLGSKPPSAYSNAYNDSLYLNYSNISRQYLDSLCKVLQIGDSHTQYSTPQVSDALWNKFGYGGFGWQNFKETWFTSTNRTTGLAKTAGWTEYNRNTTDSLWGVDGYSIYSSTVGDSVYISPSSYMKFSKARIWYAVRSTGGNFTVRVNGGVAQAVSTSGTADIGYFNVAGLTTASNYTISCRVTSGSVILYGIDVIDTTATTGVAYYNLGHGATRLDEWGVHPSRIGKFLNTVQPNFTSIYLGYNDIGNGATPSATLALLSPFVDTIKSRVYGKEVMLISGFRMGYNVSIDTATFNPKIFTYKNLVRSLALTKSTSFLSTYDLFLSNKVINEMGLMLDFAHLSSYGNVIFSNTIKNVLVENDVRISPYGNYAFYQNSVIKPSYGDALTIDAPTGSSAIFRWKENGTETGSINTTPIVGNLNFLASNQASIGGNGSSILFLGGSSKKTMAMWDAPSATGMFYIKGTSVPVNFLELIPYGTSSIVAKIDTIGNGTLFSATVNPSSGDAITVNGTGSANSIIRFKDDGTERGAVYTLNGSANLNLWGGSGGGVNIGGNGAASALFINSSQNVAIGQAASSTARFAVKNALLANVEEWYNSRATLLAKIDSVGKFQTGGLTSVGAFGVANIVDTVTYTAVGSSIASKNLTATAGLYRFTYTIFTVSAGSAGTAQITLSFNNGAAKTMTSAAIDLTSTASMDDETFVYQVVSGTPTVSVTVTGATGSPTYTLSAIVERLK